MDYIKNSERKGKDSKDNIFNINIIIKREGKSYPLGELKFPVTGKKLQAFLNVIHLRFHYFSKQSRM